MTKEDDPSSLAVGCCATENSLNTHYPKWIGTTTLSEMHDHCTVWCSVMKFKVRSISIFTRCWHSSWSKAIHIRQEAQRARCAVCATYAQYRLNATPTECRKAVIQGYSAHLREVFANRPASPGVFADVANVAFRIGGTFALGLGLVQSYWSGCASGYASVYDWEWGCGLVGRFGLGLLFPEQL